MLKGNGTWNIIFPLPTTTTSLAITSIATFTTISEIPTTTPTTTTTPPKTIWVKILGKEYYVPNEAENEADAQDYCNSQGGILFEPKSAKVNKNVTKFAKKTIRNPRIWLGIYENDSTNGQFVYVSDDKLIVWTNWKSGQPDGDGKENCVALETISYKWVDVDCDEAYNFICERGKSTLLMQIKDKPLKPTNFPSRYFDNN